MKETQFPVSLPLISEEEKNLVVPFSSPFSLPLQQHSNSFSSPPLSFSNFPQYTLPPQTNYNHLPNYPLIPLEQQHNYFYFYEQQQQKIEEEARILKNLTQQANSILNLNAPQKKKQKRQKSRRASSFPLSSDSSLALSGDSSLPSGACPPSPFLPSDPFDPAQEITIPEVSVITYTQVVTFSQRTVITRKTLGSQEEMSLDPSDQVNLKIDSDDVLDAFLMNCEENSRVAAQNTSSCAYNVWT
jgi:hypothetical protein